MAVPSPVLIAQPSSETPNTTAVEDARCVFRQLAACRHGLPRLRSKSATPRSEANLKQVTNSTVSVTSGEVKVNVDLKIGPLFEVSSVLRSLGHAPDVEHHELVGVKASSVAQTKRRARPAARSCHPPLPGVLDAEVSDDDRILVQLVVTTTRTSWELEKQRLRRCWANHSSQRQNPTASVRTSGDSSAEASLVPSCCS